MPSLDTMKYWRLSSVLRQTLFPTQNHPHPNASLQLTVDPLPESLGTAPTTITWAGEEPCWPYYATVLYDLCFCLSISATLINIWAHAHKFNLNYFECKQYHTLIILSITADHCITEGRITLDYIVLVIAFSGPMHFSSYSMNIHLCKDRRPSAGTLRCMKKVEKCKKKRKQQQDLSCCFVVQCILVTKP